LSSKAGHERYDQIVAFAKQAARRVDEYSRNGHFPIAAWLADVSASTRGSGQAK
jgi:hypothetical protein